MFELNPDYSKRDCSLPPGCKDLIDAIRLEANWKTFFDSYWKLIYGVAIKAGLNDAEAQESRPGNHHRCGETRKGM